MVKKFNGKLYIEHVRGTDLEKIVKELKENEDKYAPMNLNIQKIEKSERYTIEIKEGYIDTITVTEVEK